MKNLLAGYQTFSPNYKKFTESDALSQNHLRDVKGMYWGCVYTYYTKTHTLCKLADLFYDQLK